MDHTIETRIAALEAEIAGLKALLADQDGGAPHTSDRRGMMKMLAAGAVGAVTSAAVLAAQPAAAAPLPDVLVQGVDNTGANTTGIIATGGTAVRVDGTPYGIEVNGGTANARFVGGGKTPVGTSGKIGELYVDSIGNWWAATSTTTTTPAAWRKLAGPATAGQLHLLPTPVRVYDSRPGSPPGDIGPKTPVAGFETRTITSTLNSSGVPATVNAVLINLTVTKPQAAGFGTVWPSGVWPGTSNINFASGETVGTTTVVACGSQATFLFLASVAADFIIDAVGYYQ